MIFRACEAQRLDAARYIRNSLFSWDEHRKLWVTRSNGFVSKDFMETLMEEAKTGDEKR